MFCEETLNFLHHWILNLPNTSLSVDQVSALTSADLMQPLSTAITYRQDGAFLQVGSAITGTVALTFITVSVEPLFKLFGDLVSRLVQVGLPLRPWLEKTQFLITCATMATAARAISLIRQQFCRVLYGVSGCCLCHDLCFFLEFPESWAEADPEVVAATVEFFVPPE